MVVMLKWQRLAQQRVVHSFHAFQYFFVVHTEWNSPQGTQHC
jgi:hypothetical protein